MKKKGFLLCFQIWIVQLVGCVLLGLEEDGEDIPPASKLSEIKLENGEYTTLVDVFMPAVRSVSKTK